MPDDVGQITEQLSRIADALERLVAAPKPAAEKADSRTRRSLDETIDLAAAMLRDDPFISRSELAHGLRISERQLRNVIQAARTRSSTST